jgi:RNA recognition motif-containing protein
MSTSDDAEKCIQYLHRTELHGRVISVEKVRFIIIMTLFATKPNAMSEPQHTDYVAPLLIYAQNCQSSNIL